jgi:hypothetical protein
MREEKRAEKSLRNEAKRQIARWVKNQIERQEEG